jgi:hypothetical protein
VRLHEIQMRIKGRVNGRGRWTTMRRRTIRRQGEASGERVGGGPLAKGFALLLPRTTAATHKPPLYIPGISLRAETP